MPKDIKTIGLISDTHGLLRPEALRALRGSDLIIHAGDVGNLKILEALEGLAPVVAVRGNMDTAAWAVEQLPATNVAEAPETQVSTWSMTFMTSILTRPPAASELSSAGTHTSRLAPNAMACSI
jgi:putative phosphoesterase